MYPGLNRPEETTVIIVGIDPGVSNLGYSALSYDLVTGEIKLIEVNTFVTDKLLRTKPWLADKLGERYAKLEILEEKLVEVFGRHSPASVCSEAPYLGRFPQAFAALTECLYMERKALLRHSTEMFLFSIDPSTVKRCVGVNGKSSDKKDMTNALKALKEIDTSGWDLDSLDEHSIDAIAVAYSEILRLEGRLPPPQAKKPKKKRSGGRRKKRKKR